MTTLTSTPGAGSAGARSGGPAARPSSWDDVAQGYDRWLRAAGCRPGTIALRHAYLRRLRAQVTCGPTELTLDDLLLFVSEPSWAPETRRCALSLARGLGRYLVRSGRRLDDPATLLPPVHVPRGLPRPAPESALEAALVAATPRERAMLALAAYAGLRRAEIATLHSRDVADGELRITGKGGKVRPIPLHPELARALVPVLEDLPDGGRYVFPGRDDGHLAPATVGRVVTALLPARWTTHTLRHRAATVAYGTTRDLRATQQFLGHASSTTTERYTKVSDEALLQVALAAGPRQVAS